MQLPVFLDEAVRRLERYFVTLQNYDSSSILVNVRFPSSPPCSSLLSSKLRAIARLRLLPPSRRVAPSEYSSTAILTDPNEFDENSIEESVVPRAVIEINRRTLCEKLVETRCRRVHSRRVPTSWVSGQSGVKRHRFDMCPSLGFLHFSLFLSLVPALQRSEYAPLV